MRGVMGWDVHEARDYSDGHVRFVFVVDSVEMADRPSRSSVRRNNLNTRTQREARGEGGGGNETQQTAVP